MARGKFDDHGGEQIEVARPESVEAPETKCFKITKH
jgi:hypothetical protein